MRKTNPHTRYESFVAFENGREQAQRAKRWKSSLAAKCLSKHKTTTTESISSPRSQEQNPAKNGGVNFLTAESISRSRFRT